MKLSNLRGLSKKLSVEIGEGISVEIVYRPYSVTIGMFEAIKQNTDADFGFVIQQILNQVESWNITDDDEIVLPVTEEIIKTIPLQVLTSILQAIDSNESVKKTN